MGTRICRTFIVLLPWRSPWAVPRPPSARPRARDVSTERPRAVLSGHARGRSWPVAPRRSWPRVHDIGSLIREDAGSARRVSLFSTHHFTTNTEQGAYRISGLSGK